jgi:putative phosphoesterase
MRIVAVADTHSRPHPKMAERLAELRPAMVLHAGDIGDLSVLDELAAAAQAPVYAVRGNIDDRSTLPDCRTIDVESPPFRIFMTHIAVAGIRIRADVARQAKAAGAQLIVCGHSHVPFIVQEKGLTLFNPGSIGPKRFSLPIVFGVIEVAPGAPLRLSHHECETGARWLPP